MNLEEKINRMELIAMHPEVLKNKAAFQLIKQKCPDGMSFLEFYESDKMAGVRNELNPPPPPELTAEEEQLFESQKQKKALDDFNSKSLEEQRKIVSATPQWNQSIIGESSKRNVETGQFSEKSKASRVREKTMQEITKEHLPWRAVDLGDITIKEMNDAAVKNENATFQDIIEARKASDALEGIGITPEEFSELTLAEQKKIVQKLPGWNEPLPKGEHRSSERTVGYNN